MTLFQLQRDSSNRPGQMTVAMRVGQGAASAQRGPKVLRIGVVQDGRVREERTIDSPAHVSVGTNEDNTFLVSGSAQPTSMRLFERIDGAYHLNFTPEMQGRVVLASGVFELRELEASAERVAGGGHRLALGEEARGRVVLGDVALLFHFVAPPPICPRPVLPAAVLRGPQQVDWNSTICAALSFFLHFMLLGAVYSDWADPVIDDDVSTAGLIDSLKNLPPPPPVEDKSADDEAPAAAHEEPAAPRAKPAPTPRRSAWQQRGTPAQASPAAEAGLTSQLEQIDAAILGVLNTDQPATSAVLKRSEASWGALDSVAASRAGVSSGNEPRLGAAGAPVLPGASPGLRELGKTTLSSEDRGGVASVKGPSPVAQVAAPSTAGGVVSNAARVVAGMRAGFSRCYQRGLAENPDAGGSIKLTIRVGPGGEVVGVTASPSGNLSATVVSCVQARVGVAQFEPPEGGSAVISVPVTFVKQ